MTIYSADPTEEEIKDRLTQLIDSQLLYVQAMLPEVEQLLPLIVFQVGWPATEVVPVGLMAPPEQWGDASRAMSAQYGADYAVFLSETYITGQWAPDGQWFPLEANDADVRDLLNDGSKKIHDLPPNKRFDGVMIHAEGPRGIAVQRQYLVQADRQLGPVVLDTLKDPDLEIHTRFSPFLAINAALPESVPHTVDFSQDRSN